MVMMRETSGAPQAGASEGLRAQIETYGGFSRYDMAVDIAENDPDGSCEAGPLG